jgi:Phospholipase/Carboxylesterase
VGGFSQGYIISLLLELGARYADRVAGIMGLSGALASGSMIAKAKVLSPSIPQDLGLLSLEKDRSDQPCLFLDSHTFLPEDKGKIGSLVDREC